MLWYKGWLETRFRLLFILVISTVVLFLQHSAARAAPQPRLNGLATGQIMFVGPMLAMMGCAMLGGAGIATQPSLQASKGLHGSTLFTLSLPVSRLRLLAIRASTGWLAMVALVAVLCCEMWLVSPGLSTMGTEVEMVEYAGTLIACASAVYGLSVLLATFLDDQWRTWGTMMVTGVLWWLSSHIQLPASANLFRGMGSPLLAHTVPWGAMAFSVALAAVLLVAALKVAQAREY